MKFFSLVSTSMCEHPYKNRFWLHEINKLTEFSPALLWLQRTTETSMIQPTVTPPPAATATNLHIHSSVLKQQKQVSVLLLTTLYENQEDITRIQKTLYCHCIVNAQLIQINVVLLFHWCRITKLIRLWTWFNDSG